MKKILKYLFLLFLIMLVLGGMVFVFKSIRIQKITCESQYGACSTNLQSSISNLQSKKENLLQTRNDLNNLLNNDKSIEKYAINLKLPLVFSVYVIEKKAIAAFLLKDNNFDLVTGKGEIIANVKETALPKVTSYSVLDSTQLAYISDLTSRLYTFYGVTAGKVTADGFTIDLSDGKKVIFPLSGDGDLLLGSMALILSRLPRAQEASTICITCASGVSTIDLRFKNPVLR